MIGIIQSSSIGEKLYPINAAIISSLEDEQCCYFSESYLAKEHFSKAYLLIDWVAVHDFSYLYQSLLEDIQKVKADELIFVSSNKKVISFLKVKKIECRHINDLTQKKGIDNIELDYSLVNPKIFLSSVFVDGHVAPLRLLNENDDLRSIEMIKKEINALKSYGINCFEIADSIESQKSFKSLTTFSELMSESWYHLGGLSDEYELSKIKLSHAKVIAVKMSRNFSFKSSGTKFVLYLDITHLNLLNSLNMIVMLFLSSNYFGHIYYYGERSFAKSLLCFSGYMLQALHPVKICNILKLSLKSRNNFMKLKLKLRRLLS